MIKFFTIFVFFVLVCCGPRFVGLPLDGGYIAITNKTSDLLVKISIVSSQRILKREECVKLTKDQFSSIQASFRPVIMSPSWLESCSNNRDCEFNRGAWMKLFKQNESGNNEVITHYEVQGNSTSKQVWTAGETHPSSQCSVF